MVVVSEQSASPTVVTAIMKIQHQGDPRRSLRQSVRVEAKLRVGPTNFLIDLCDLSTEGFRFHCIYTITSGQRCVLKLDTFEPMGANIMWIANNEGGCRFERPLHPSVATAIAQRHPGLAWTG